MSTLYFQSYIPSACDRALARPWTLHKQRKQSPGEGQSPQTLSMAPENYPVFIHFFELNYSPKANVAYSLDLYGPQAKNGLYSF